MQIERGDKILQVWLSLTESLLKLRDRMMKVEVFTG